MIRGIRGAIKVTNNIREEILESTGLMFAEALQKNGVMPHQIVSVIFTVTPDINAAFPATAVRMLGEPWNHIASICCQEIPVPGFPDKMIRMLLTVETDKGLSEIYHPYLRGAEVLRPDRTGEKEKN